MFRALVLISIAGTAAAAAQWSDVVELIKTFSPLMQTGAAISIGVQGQTERLHSYEFGRTTLETIMPIASATKWISGAAILGAVQEGHLNLQVKRLLDR